MNVLLAEADIPYDKLLEMDEHQTVISPNRRGADHRRNDVTNPAAREDQSHPIYGMPEFLDVDKARTVMVIKRSMGAALQASKSLVLHGPHADALRRREKAFVAPS